MFDHRPSQEEISKWFAGFKLHEGLKHEQYVGGIVAIETKDRGVSTWMLYINATARISYFWDWCDHNKYIAHIDVSEPIDRIVELPADKKSRQFYMVAEVVVVETADNPDAQGRVVRQVTGRKQVDTTSFRRGYNGAAGTVVPDSNAIMKAETGSIARALGALGMLALPGSGIATAEDMVEYLGVQAEPAKEEAKAAPQTKAVSNPKK